ncbi:hypothetical protein D3C78_1418810 [compost metagenome]
MRHFQHRLRQAVGQHLGHFGREVFAPLHDLAHRIDQHHGIAGLVGIALRAGLEAAQCVLVFGVHGDDQHLDGRMCLAQTGEHFQPAASRHVEVEQQDIAGGGAQHIAQL